MNPKLVISKLVSSELVHNSAKLLSANVFAQTVALLVYPILTRYYTPDNFGLFNLFLSIGSVICIFSSAEYQYAIVLPKSEGKAVSCFHAGFITNVIIAGICLVSVCFSEQIAELFDTPQLKSWYWLMPFYVFAMGLWTLLNYWYTRNKQFSNISGYQVSQNLLSSATKVGFGIGGFLSGGLIVSSVLAPIISIAISIKSAYKKSVFKLMNFNFAKTKEAAKEYKNFPKYSLPRSVINNLSGNLPILLLSPFFGLSEIGFLGMALTLAFRPINMIASSLYQVFFQRTAERVQNKESIKPFFVKFIRNTMLIAIPSFALLYFTLPWLTNCFLGDGWESTATYIRMMLPWITMSCLVAPICYLSDIFKKQRMGLYYEIVLVLVRCGGLIWGIMLHSFSIAVIAYCSGSAIVIFAQLIWYWHLIVRYENTLSIKK